MLNFESLCENANEDIIDHVIEEGAYNFTMACIDNGKTDELEALLFVVESLMDEKSAAVDEAIEIFAFESLLPFVESVSGIYLDTLFEAKAKPTQSAGPSDAAKAGEMLKQRQLQRDIEGSVGAMGTKFDTQRAALKKSLQDNPNKGTIMQRLKFKAGQVMSGIKRGIAKAGGAAKNAAGRMIGNMRMRAAGALSAVKNIPSRVAVGAMNRATAMAQKRAVSKP